MKTAALIVAAGSGSRVGTALPKQYANLAGRPVLSWAVETFLNNQAVDIVQVVIAPAHADHYAGVSADGRPEKLLPPVLGGPTRQASVRNGLHALRAHNPEQVLIHDAARPFVSDEIISRVIEALANNIGAIAAIPQTDTLKQADQGYRVRGTVDRTGLWRAQTPQGFRFNEILAAHDAAADAGKIDLTDDAAVAEWADLPVAIVMGSESNRKLTTAEDMAMVAAARNHTDIRTGTGFDVHRFEAGDHVWLCGIRLPHTHALAGHSDADVALHALTDALLGALGEGDIGEHFPDSDPQWRGASSHIFLTEAARRVRARGGMIGNVDLTLLCEAPKVAPYRAMMRQRIADILATSVERVAVKATTTEGLGFVGRGEGIAALATATVFLPSSRAD